MRRLLLIVLAVITTVGAVSVRADEYTINQYITDYYIEAYGEEVSAPFDKVAVQHTETDSGMWVLPYEAYSQGLLDEKITKVSETFIVETPERYYISFNSRENNIVYICITAEGELFFGRYADYNKVNYCEYTIDNPEGFMEKMKAVCKTGENGYISWTSDEDLFSDISNHWAEQSVINMAESGIVSGYPDGTFRPDETVTRAEFAKIAACAFNLDENSDLAEFNDLDANAWYYPYIEKSAMYIPKYRLPVQYPSMEPYLNNANGGFLPDGQAVRMHIAEALVEIKLRKEGILPELPSVQIMHESVNQWFNDGYELFVMHNGEPAVNAARMVKYTYLAHILNIMQGDDKGYFNPYGYVTRAELAVMIDRILSVTVK